MVPDAEVLKVKCWVVWSVICVYQQGGQQPPAAPAAQNGCGGDVISMLCCGYLLRVLPLLTFHLALMVPQVLVEILDDLQLGEYEVRRLCSRNHTQFLCRLLLHTFLWIFKEPATPLAADQAQPPAAAGLDAGHCGGAAAKVPAHLLCHRQAGQRTVGGGAGRWATARCCTSILVAGTSAHKMAFPPWLNPLYMPRVLQRWWRRRGFRGMWRTALANLWSCGASRWSCWRSSQKQVDW